jgi:hypothetical protein
MSRQDTFCSAFDEDGERMPTEHEAIAVASALIVHYEPMPGLAGSDFDKGMQALQRLMGRRPNAGGEGRGASPRTSPPPCSTSDSTKGPTK